jgi:hypothetical protein
MSGVIKGGALGTGTQYESFKYDLTNSLLITPSRFRF